MISHKNVNSKPFSAVLICREKNETFENAPLSDEPQQDGFRALWRGATEQLLIFVHEITKDYIVKFRKQNESKYDRE